MTTCSACAFRSPVPDIRVAAWAKANGLNRNKRRQIGIGNLSEMSICGKDDKRVVGPQSGACESYEEKGT